MKIRLFLTLFLSALIGFLNAQEFENSMRFQPGLNVFVVTSESGTMMPLEKATVKLVMGQDTVLLQTDRNGQAVYDKRFFTPVVDMIASAPGYETVRTSRRAPRPGQSVGRQIILKKEEATVPDTESSAAKSPEGR